MQAQFFFKTSIYFENFKQESSFVQDIASLRKLLISLYPFLEVAINRTWHRAVHQLQSRWRPRYCSSILQRFFPRKKLNQTHQQKQHNRQSLYNVIILRLPSEQLERLHPIYDAIFLSIFFLLSQKVLNSLSFRSPSPCQTQSFSPEIKFPLPPEGQDIAIEAHEI